MAFKDNGITFTIGAVCGYFVVLVISVAICLIACGECIVAQETVTSLKIEAAKKGYAEFVYDFEVRQTVFKWKEN